MEPSRLTLTTLENLSDLIVNLSEFEKGGKSTILGGIRLSIRTPEAKELPLPNYSFFIHTCNHGIAY